MADFNPDAYLAGKDAPQSSPQPGVPQAQSQDVDPLQLQQFDPGSYLQTKDAANYDVLQDKFGGIAQQALAGVEGVARGGSVGASDFLEQQLARVAPETFAKEAILGRQAANPVTSGLGQMIGGGALIGATGGLAGPAEALLAARGIGPVAASALGTALEGGAFGLGNAISDLALGDPNLNAQKLLSDIGMGAAIGGSFGVLSKAIPAIPALFRKAKAAEGAAPESLETAIQAPQTLGDHPVIDTPGNRPAKSYDELRKQIESVKKYAGDPDLYALPQKPVVQDALPDINSLLEVNNIPINDMDLGSLDSQEARDIYKTKMQMPGEAGQLLRDATVARKKGLLGGIDRQIENIAPEYESTSSALEAGNRATDLLTDAIQTKRDSIGPVIGDIKGMALPEENHLSGVIDYLTNPESSPRANPKIANMFDTTGDTVQVKKYNTGMGIDRSTYNAVDQAVGSLKGNPTSFDSLFDIRKGLEQNVDVSKLGDASKEIGNAKAAMMDYIQDTAQKVSPELKVREAFRNYAANEEDANYIEKQLGAQIGSSNWRSLAKGKPEENILDKIFRDSKTVDATKRILGPDQFKKVLADYMSTLRGDMTQEGVFSSNKFYTALRRNQYGLGQAFADQPQTLKTIQSYLTGLKTFVDHMPANPSGTAPTLMRSLMDAGYNIPKILGNLKEYGGSKLEEFRQAKEINAALSGQKDKVAQLSSINQMIKNVGEKITSGAKSLFNSPSVRGGILSGGVYSSDREYNSRIGKIQKVSSNPQQFLDDLADNTESLYSSAPNITQNLSLNMMRALQFLNTKIVQPATNFILSDEPTPTPAQKISFNRYYDAVNDPIGTFKQVKDGTFSNEHLEALQAVHPQLLQEMRQKVLENFNVNKAKKLPYSQKVSLAKFLGQPLDANMTPQAIQSNQMSLNGPQLSKQGVAPSGRKNPLGGLKELKLSDRSGTSTERDMSQEA